MTFTILYRISSFFRSPLVSERFAIKKGKHYLFGHFNHQHKRRLPLSAHVPLDKLFMATFPHSSPFTDDADIHATKAYVGRLRRCKGSLWVSTRIIQLSYFYEARQPVLPCRYVPKADEDFPLFFSLSFSFFFIIILVIEWTIYFRNIRTDYFPMISSFGVDLCITVCEASWVG